MRTNILFFDIPTTSKFGPISPNTWKVRLALNLKRLNYTTQWVLTCDIESTLKPLGIPPTAVKPNGAPHYTLPAIIDRTNPSNHVLLSDSTPIIEYLEQTYPTTNINLFPEGTKSHLHLFEHFALTKILSFAIPNLFITSMAHLKEDREFADFVTRMESRFGKSFDQIEKRGAEREAVWKELEQTFGVLGACFKKSEGPFFAGNNITLADCNLAAVLHCFRGVSPDDGWDRISTWDDGYWGKFLANFDDYLSVDNHPV